MNQKTVDPGTKANVWTQWLITWGSSILHWLTGTLFGTAVLFAALWWYFRHWGQFKPFTAPELFTWFNSLEPASRIAIGGWFLTMLGFMIAFWTASFTWRKHKELELRIEAAKAAHTCFEGAFIRLKLINQYLGALADANASARQHPDDPQLVRHLKELNDFATKFIELRKELDNALVDTTSMIAGYIPIFLNVVTVPGKMEDARDALVTVLTALWTFEPPKIDPNANQFVQTFLGQFDPVNARYLSQNGERALRYASTLSGFARGRLFGSVVRVNGWALIWTTPKKLYSVIGEVTRRND